MSADTSSVISLAAVRNLKKLESDDGEYKIRINQMEKLDLLEEMIRFQEERAKVEDMPVEMMIRGKILFTALEKNAETQELKILTRSYRRHLEFELKAYQESFQDSK